MEYRRLGKSDLKVSVIALGSATFGGTTPTSARTQAQADAIVHAALDFGITFFDTAQTYGRGESQVMLCKALGARRSQAIICNKFRDFGTWDKEEILRRLKDSLSRMGTDYLDLYKMHWPKTVLTVADVEVMVDAFQTGIRQGLMRYAGVSNFRRVHLDLLTPEARELLVANQAPYDLLDRSYDADGATLSCLEDGISYVVYSPLRSGLLSGRFTRENCPAGDSIFERPDVYPEVMKVVDEVKAVAAESGRTPTQVALNWLLRQPVVGALISGSVQVPHLEENVGAVGWKLTLAQMKRLESASATFQAHLRAVAQPTD